VSPPSPAKAKPGKSGKGGAGKGGKPGKNGKGGPSGKSWKSSGVSSEALDELLPPLPPSPPPTEAERAEQADRDSLLAELRGAQDGSKKEQALMARWNALPPRNAARFAPPTSETLPIVLLAHDRELYLRPGLRLWAAVKGIEQAVLVASHHGTHDGVWRLVEGVRFCAVQQLIFPHAGRYRGAHVLKLHFTWAVDQAFRMWSAREVAYMEDDYWVTPDFFRSALRLRDARARHCAECVGTVVGDHPRDWTAEHANAAAWASAGARPLLHRLYVGCAYNSPAGMSLPRATWDVVRASADAYCDPEIAAYDDAIHALQNELRRPGVEPGRRRLEAGWLTNAFPRTIHVGRCGGISFQLERGLGNATARAAACNVTHDLLQFVRTWVAPWRAGGPFAGEALGANERWEPKEPRQKWRVPEGLRMCRDRYAWNGTGAPVGVAISKAPPASFGASFGASCKGALGL